MPIQTMRTGKICQFDEYMETIFKKKEQKRTPEVNEHPNK